MTRADRLVTTMPIWRTANIHTHTGSIALYRKALKFRTSHHVTCISSSKQTPHAVGYLPFLEFWRLFSNCCTRKLLRPLCGWGGFYTALNNGDNAKKVPIAFGDGWKRVNTNAKNNDTSLADAVKTPIYWEKFRPVDKRRGECVGYTDQRWQLSVWDEIWLTAVMQEKKSRSMEMLTLPSVNNTQSVRVQGPTVISKRKLHHSNVKEHMRQQIRRCR